MNEFRRRAILGRMPENPYQAPEERGAKPPKNSSSTRPRDLFGVAVRSIGLLQILWGFAYVTGTITPSEGFTQGHYLLSMTSQMVAGVIVLFSADNIVDMCYGPKPGADQDD